MRLQDEDKSTLALYYIYSAYELSSHRDGNNRVLYRLEVISGGRSTQEYRYTDRDTLLRDLDFIAKWIEVREMGSYIGDN